MGLAWRAASALAIAWLGIATTACERRDPALRPSPAVSSDMDAPTDCASVRSCVLRELPHEFFPTTRTDWAARVRHCLGSAPNQRGEAARLCLPIVFARDTRNEREVALCSKPPPPILYPLSVEDLREPALAIAYQNVSSAECLCLGRIHLFDSSLCLATWERSRLSEDDLRVDQQDIDRNPTFELVISGDASLSELLQLPRTSALSVRGRPFRGIPELKRRFLDLIEHPPGRIDFASESKRIESHEFYFLDRLLVDRLVKKMTELGLHALHTSGQCTSTDIVLTADKRYAIDSTCEDRRTKKLLEFVREMEVVAADAAKVVKRRVPPATCAELHTLPVSWSLVTRRRVIDLRYVDWALETP